MVNRESTGMKLLVFATRKMLSWNLIKLMRIPSLFQLELTSTGVEEEEEEDEEEEGKKEKERKHNGGGRGRRGGGKGGGRRRREEEEGKDT